MVRVVAVQRFRSVSRRVPTHADQHQAAFRPDELTLLVLPRGGQRPAAVARTRPAHPLTRATAPEARYYFDSSISFDRPVV